MSKKSFNSGEDNWGFQPVIVVSQNKYAIG
jgi:hypothetical protein